ncbi:unnamed protein product [Linum tenue]|uniref:Transmembrane protein n=1 Tax=Linum tenue TaxID=586396 RepID=A0AAV0GX39_9ROSI|nr:unnamed protein product [Linum tenue]
MHYYRRTGDSIFDSFTLNPLPYPVLLLLAVIAIFLGASWYFTYEELVYSTESSMGLGLFVLPVLLIFLARWLSSVESRDAFFFGMSSPWDRRRRTHQPPPSEGSSPWGVVAVIVLLLVLLQYQSSFLDSWFF